MSAIVAALLAELDDQALAELARRLQPHLAEPARVGDDGWLSTKQAAAYLGITVNALHKLTRARALPFEQSSPGGKCWFRRADLDGWRSA
jgi:excisionase family DNA binding protein